MRGYLHKVIYKGTKGKDGLHILFSFFLLLLLQQALVYKGHSNRDLASGCPPSPASLKPLIMQTGDGSAVAYELWVLGRLLGDIVSFLQ